MHTPASDRDPHLDKLGVCMNDAAHRIQDALHRVSSLRDGRRGNTALDLACREIKRLQARRFTATYADLLSSARYAAASRFFLHELYSDKDYTERDQQFARIAATIAKLFPKAVVETAAMLAEVHALTEQLDDAMAREWMAYTDTPAARNEYAVYIQSWRRAADPGTRRHQLEQVLQLGHSLDRLIRLPGLRMLLKMMRGPAAAAGLGSLQHFLESGFDAFSDMRGAAGFLRLIGEREMYWINALFEEDAVACETLLRDLIEPRGAH